MQAYSQAIQGAIAVDLFDAKMNSVTYSPDGRFLAVGGCTDSHSGGCINSEIVSNSFLLVLDAKTAEVSANLPETNTTVNSLVFTSDGEKLISAHYPAQVEVWDLQSGKKDQTIWRVPNTYCYPRLALNHSDSRLAVTCGGQLFILDYPSGDLIATQAGFSVNQDLPKFNANDTRLAVFNDDFGRLITVYDTATWLPISTIILPGDLTQTAAFSPDGKTLATVEGSPDAHILLWDVDTGQQIAELDDEFIGIQAVSFSPDGSLLLAAGIPSMDQIYNSISIWDAVSLQKIGVMHADNFPTRFLFSADGSSFIVDNSYYLYYYRWSLPDADAANMHQAVMDFFSALHRGDYQSAAALFQPTGDVVSYLDGAGIPTDDYYAMLDTLCAQETQPCMAVDQMLFEGVDDQGGYIFLIRFTALDGSIYIDPSGDSDIFLWTAFDGEGLPKINSIPSFLYP